MSTSLSLQLEFLAINVVRKTCAAQVSCRGDTIGAPYATRCSGDGEEYALGGTCVGAVDCLADSAECSYEDGCDPRDAAGSPQW